MRVFVAGATGAIGRQLVPRLVQAGHEVHGMTRSESKRALLSDMGAVAVVADALDPDQVADAVGRARPDVIVHQLTAIPAGLDLRRFDRDFAPTNRLRTEVTDHLLSAGHAVGVRRFVAQSVAAYGAYARAGGPVKSEEDPLEIEQSEDVDLAVIQAIDAYVRQLHDGFVPTQSHMSRSLWRFIDRSQLPSEHIEAKVMEFLRKRVLVKRQTINGQGNELVTTELNVQHPLVIKALELGGADDEIVKRLGDRVIGMQDAAMHDDEVVIPWIGIDFRRHQFEPAA